MVHRDGPPVAGDTRETIASTEHPGFLTRRLYNQVAMSVAYPNLQVRLLELLPSLISFAICTEEAMRALAAVQGAGVSVTHLHASTLKPFGDPGCSRPSRGAGPV